MRFTTYLLFFILCIGNKIYSQPVVVFHEDFEYPSQNDSVICLSQPITGYEFNINSRLHSGTTSLQSDSCQVKTGATVYLYTDTFSTIGHTYIILTFDQICKIDYYDIAQVEVSNNGGLTWNALTYSQYQGSGIFHYGLYGYQFSSDSYNALWVPTSASALPQNNWWKTEVFNISNVAANCNAVIVRFKLMDSGDPGPVYNKGWYLDNIKVTKSPSETTPPVITPSTPILSGTFYFKGPFTIKAKVTDPSGIQAARIFYTVNGGTTDSVEMVTSVNDIMVGTLPIFDFNDTICYYFKAYDNSPAHNVRSFPDTSCYQFSIHHYINLPYYDNFDDSLCLWVNSFGGTQTNTSWQRGIPAYGSTNSAHSSPYAWDINLTVPYYNNALCILTSPAFYYSNFHKAALSFWINYNTENLWDGAWMEYSTDGNTWHVLGGLSDTVGTNWYTNYFNIVQNIGWTGNSNGWKKCFYPLDFLASQNSQVQFRFLFSSEVTGNFDGFTLDDFEIPLWPHQNASLKEITTPLSGCGLGNEEVTIKIMNDGVDTISGGLEVGYLKVGSDTSIIEIINDTIFPEDTMIYTFHSLIDLSTVGIDTTYIIKSWVRLTNDTLNYDDTVTRQIISDFIPETPVSYNDTIIYGTYDTLTVSSPYSISWYTDYSNGTVIGTGSTLITPFLYQNTVYYPGITSPNGCHSQRARDTIFVGPVPLYEASLIKIVNPVSGYHLGNNNPVKTLIKNYGTQPLCNIFISYQLNNQQPVTETYSDTLLPGDTVTFTFANVVNLENYQTYHLKCWVWVSGDNNYLNDTMLALVTNNMYNYCTSKALFTNHVDIGSVVFSNLNHGNSLPINYNPTSSSMYKNYSLSVSPIQLIQGQSFEVKISPIHTTSFYQSCCKIFIDWNDDGQFSEETETAFTAGPNSTTNIDFSGVVFVPLNAVRGIIRVRFVNMQTNNPNNIHPCGTYDYGETEDYSAMIYEAPEFDAGITLINSPSFSYRSGNALQPSINIKNSGNSDIDSLTVYYQFDNSDPVSENWAGLLSSGQGLTIDFPETVFPDGIHNFQAWVDLTEDQISFNDSIQIETKSLPIISIPGFDQFDTATNFYAEGNTTNWVNGEVNPAYFPVTPISPPGVWCTNLNTTGYQAYANCNLYSPYYDFTNINNEYISFWYKCKAEGGYDGTRLEYSLNDGKTWNTLGIQNDPKGVNWYNFFLTPSMHPGWSGNSTTWKKASYLLSELNNAGYVRFRFVFISDGSTQSSGMAIDDFTFTNYLNNTSLTDISNISGILAGDTNKVSCIIKNLGANAITNLQINYRVNNSVFVTESWTAPPGFQLSTYDTLHFTFSTPYLVPPQDYTLTVFTSNINDENHADDTIQRQLFGEVNCQTFLPALDASNTNPSPSDSGYIHSCLNQLILFAGTGNYLENDSIYHQSDETTEFIWDFGDGMSAVGKIVSHKYLLPGGYEVYLALIDRINCQTQKKIVARVNIAGNPVASINYNPYYCPGSLVSVGNADTNLIQLNNTTYFGPSLHKIVRDSSQFIPCCAEFPGLAFTSGLQITDAVEGTVITSSDQLIEVNIEMEHSRIGDIQMKLTCPNGQSAILKEYTNSGDAFLGIPLGGRNHSDFDCSYPPVCLSDPEDNPPGTGWTYSFSVLPQYNTMQTYANSGNCTPPQGVDVILDSSSYMPYESFSNLMGCPINGIWNLEVFDYQASDNGWIFSWGMTLHYLKINSGWQFNVPIDTIIWHGPGIVPVNSYVAQIQQDSLGEHTFPVVIIDDYGCIYDTSLTINIDNPLLVECSPDQYFEVPVATFISCQAFNGIPPLTYLWSEGDQGISALVTPLETTTYFVSITDALGCRATDSMTITIGFCPFIEGTVRYYNTSQTPLNGVTVILSDNDIPVTDTLTGSDGDFRFNGICDTGFYDLGIDCSLANGGINASDALLALQYFVGIYNLSPLQHQAADVDNTGLVNAADALNIVKYFVGMSSSFPVGEWVFDNAQLELVPGNSVNTTLYGLCAGDIDGSFIPSNKKAPSIFLSEQGEMITVDNQQITVPVTCPQNVKIGAISLIINLPDEIKQVTDVYFGDNPLENNGTLVFNTLNNKLYIGWYCLTPTLLNAGDILMTLKVIMKENKVPASISFSADANSVIADANAIEIPFIELLVPKLTLMNDGFWLSQNQPNPFTNETEFTYNLPAASNVTIRICNLVGECVEYQNLGEILSGLHNYTLNATGLSPGVYHFLMEVSNDNKSEKELKKILVAD